MLVLERRLSEQICIGQSIVVTVSRIKANQVRLAIEAPSDVAVRRAAIEGEGKSVEPRRPKPRSSGPRRSTRKETS